MLRFMLLFVLCLAMGSLYAQNDGYTDISQDTSQFEIIYPQVKVRGSLYKYISIIDERPDTSYLGTIETNKAYEAPVFPKKPLADQFRYLMDSLTDMTAQPGKLLLQIKRFTFARIDEQHFRGGCTALRMYLYAKMENGYQLLDVLDTVQLIKTATVFGRNMKKPLFIPCSAILSSFIGKNLLARGDAASSFTFSDVRNMDSIMKSRTTLYNTDSLANGVYKTFRSFRNQTPDYTVFAINYYDGKIEGVQ